MWNLNIRVKSPGGEKKPINKDEKKKKPLTSNNCYVIRQKESLKKQLYLGQSLFLCYMYYSLAGCV